MKNTGGLRTRPLSEDKDLGVSLAKAAGVSGVYVHNALAEGLYDGLIYSVDGEPCGVVWFGPRGNLIVISDDRLRGHESVLRREIQTQGWPWRIAMGARSVIDLLAEGLPRRPLAHRDQVYYCGDASDAPAPLVRDDLRLPVAEDRERLARATLALNASDLNIAPSRVDRTWLYNTIDERIRDGSCRVLGPPGGLWSKLDYGSVGPGGPVLEGVFTFPERRGRGLGAELVATCLAQSDLPVCLHVGEDNRTARSVYERAGMVAVGTCRLLLQG